MKLHELSSPKPSQQIIKVFESYFGNRIRFDRITPAQTKIMLIKIRGLLGEHRATSARHTSEKNPHYLQLVMMEQALTTKLQEVNARPQQTAYDIFADIDTENRDYKSMTPRQFELAYGKTKTAWYDERHAQKNKAADGGAAGAGNKPTVNARPQQTAYDIFNEAADGGAAGAGNKPTQTPDDDESWQSLKKTRANLDAIRKTGKKVIVWHGEGDTLYRVIDEVNAMPQQAVATAANGTGNKPTNGANGAFVVDRNDPKTQAVLKKAQSGSNLSPDEQKIITAIASIQKEAAKKKRMVKEAGELQQAQVVLASQDMVDQIQKMIEQVSAMQFKDLPALVDSIRNEIGMEQAQQFNNDSTKTLQGLIQGLQGSKTQLESAQGVLTGQAPMVPGQDAGAAPVAPTTEPAAAADSSGAAPNVPAPVPAADSSGDTDTSPADTKALGRERR